MQNITKHIFLLQFQLKFLANRELVHDLKPIQH